MQSTWTCGHVQGPFAVRAVDPATLRGSSALWKVFPCQSLPEEKALQEGEAALLLFLQRRFFGIEEIPAWIKGPKYAIECCIFQAYLLSTNHKYVLFAPRYGWSLRSMGLPSSSGDKKMTWSISNSRDVLPIRSAKDGTRGVGWMEGKEAACTVLFLPCRRAAAPLMIQKMPPDILSLLWSMVFLQQFTTVHRQNEVQV